VVPAIVTVLVVAGWILALTYAPDDGTDRSIVVWGASAIGVFLLIAFPGATAAAYREMCATLGTKVRATTTEGHVVEGEAIDVDETGALVVRTSRGLEVIRFGEVEHLR